MIIPTKEFLDIFRNTDGALSVTESIAIMNIAAQVNPCGKYIELGTHKGKSTFASVYGFMESTDYYTLWDKEWEEKRQPPRAAGITLVDIEFGASINSDEVYDKLKKLGSGLTINRSILPSVEAIVELCLNGYDWVFVDTGNHGDGLPMQEVKLLEDRIKEKGIIVFHDYKNQFTEVEAAYNYLVSTGKFESIEIEWQPIFDYVKENNLEEGNQSWHLYPELPHPPNFVGALKRI